MSSNNFQIGPSFNLFCDIAMLYNTKKLGWGGVNYKRLVEKVGEMTESAMSSSFSTALVKPGPSQDRFLRALSSNGFDIRFRTFVPAGEEDWFSNALWQKETYMAMLDMVCTTPTPAGKQTLVLVTDSDLCVEVATFAASTWYMDILLMGIDGERLEEQSDSIKDDLTQFTPALSHETDVRTCLIDESFCG